MYVSRSILGWWDCYMCPYTACASGQHLPPAAHTLYPEPPLKKILTTGLTEYRWLVSCVSAVSEDASQWEERMGGDWWVYASSAENCQDIYTVKTLWLLQPYFSYVSCMCVVYTTWSSRNAILLKMLKSKCWEASVLIKPVFFPIN